MYYPINNRRNNEQFVERENDVINIYGLNRSQAVSQFIYAVNSGIKAGYDNFLIEASDIEGVFPNTVVPIAALIDSYKNKNIEFEYGKISNALQLTKFDNPQLYEMDSTHILSRVWRFSNSNEIYKIVEAFCVELRKEDRFPEGTISSIQWSLNEVMDNVLTHSNSNCGYVMGQIHKSQKKIAFTVCDYGRGIYNSLSESQIHKPRTAIDSITLAIKEEVTRNRSVGQGNGLYGLHSIINQGKGTLEIVSSGASYKLMDGHTNTNKHLPKFSNENPGTIVDFQLNYGKNISLENALKFRGKDYSITDLYVESFDDDKGHNYYSVKERADGTGTRDSAVRIKNEIINLIKDSKKPVIIDFKGVAVISSSFADELIAKLLLELGLFQFNNLIILRGMNTQEQNILQKSVIQRLLDSLNEPNNLK
ncbi:MAG: STAS-like domain-containing protein [Bacteroidales bacterium]|nr:STAS-like domain-containing protein [Bacteroidales bacterium]